MRKYIFFALLFLFCYSSVVSFAQTVTITQVDTFAIQGLPDQPILKIKINTGSSTSYSLERLVIKSLSEDSTDISSVKLYRTIYNRFSKAEYAGEATAITSDGVKLLKDSAVFSGLTYPLNAGDNIIWVVFNLTKTSKAGHILDASIRAGGITISGSNFPTSEQNPAKESIIRQKYFFDNFEEYESSSRKPLFWTVTGDVNAPWKCEKGGYSDNPSTAKSGNLNARSYAENPTGRVSRMIPKQPLNLSLSKKPKLTFYHAQIYRPVTDKYDSLGVYYSFTSTGPWYFIKNYLNQTPEGLWVKRDVDLPDEMINSNVYIVFKSTAQNGFGVCVDSVTIYEANESTRSVKSITIDQTNKAIVPQGSENNAILRFNIGVSGNTGSLDFSSLTVNSLNTSDNDVSNVNLYYTSDSVFLYPVLVGSGNFSAGKISFTGFTRKLDSGNNYYWVTYNTKNDATPDNFLDAQINAGDIIISDGGTYPSVAVSPAGNRIIKQSVFFDNFETNKGWVFSGEFERGQPQGKGGVSFGFHDPIKAFSQTNVLGTDLGLSTNNGDYEKYATNTAVTPLIQAKYFKNTELSFARWLNAENQDSAVIEYQCEGDTKWKSLWETSSTIMEGSWSVNTITTKTLFDRNNFKIRFRLGKTNNLEEYSGWNIDDFFLTGDSIKYDAAITDYLGPFSACGLTSGEQIKIRVKNTGPKTLTNIPVKFSIDGGKNWCSEIISGTLAVDNSIDYSLSPVNLSKPSSYKVIVKVIYPGDNFSDNDSVYNDLTSVPTYTLPYNNGFEKDTTFWLSGGINSSWAKGAPTGVGFTSSYEGQNCWKTNLQSGYHLLYENSYIESPCFNLTDVEVPIVDMQYKYITALKKTGARLEYSLDGGTNWAYVPEDSYTYNWSWYNDSVRTFHDKKLGWSGQSLNQSGLLSWINGKQALPLATANNSLVRLRIHFKADSTVTVPDPGFAFDVFKLINAPYDAGVESIDELNSPACQYKNSDKLKITIKNFGLRKIRQNDTIVIGIKVNNNAVVKDTFQLNSDLNVGASQQLQMKKPVNFYNPGSYKIKAFVIEKYPNYYETNNDTTTLDVVVYPNPITNLPDTIYTSRRDTLIITAYSNTDYAYSWEFEGSPVSTTNQLDASITGFGDHYLTVTNTVSFCETKDTVFIKRLIQDAGIQSIISPNTNCGYKTPVHPVIRLKNYGTDTMKINQVIPVEIKLNKQTVLTENITLTKILAPDSVITRMLVSTLNLMSVKTDTLKIWTALATDDSTKNDTASINFQIYGYPKIFLGNDTTVKGLLTYDIIAASGFKTYSWSDGLTNTQKLTITSPGTYSVKVTDNNDCPNSDTIHVHMIIHDLQMQKLVSPLNACNQTSTTSIKCQLKNTGTDTIKVSEPIILYYQVNNGSLQQDTIIPTSMIKPNDSLQYTFRQKLDMTVKGLYAFKIKSMLANDIQPLNDSILQTVEVYGLPVVDLGEDRFINALSFDIYPGKFAQYKWQDNSTDSVWTITKSKFQQGNEYSVTVTDTHGCSSNDAVRLFLLVDDVEVTDVILPRKICSMPNNQVVNLKLTNVGNIPLTNKLIEVSYSLNGKTQTKENFYFTGAVGTSMIHTFLEPLDMSSKGIYSFKSKVLMPGDVNLLNDTATFVTNVLGYPTVDFKVPSDTLLVKLPYSLHAGPGYAEYLWQDNSVDSVYTINKANYQPSNNKFTVIVTDVNGCTATESANVIEALYNLSLTGINIPASNCTLPAGKLQVQVQNNSTVPILNQAVDFGYSINGGSQVTKQTTLSLPKGAAQTIEFDDDVNLSDVGTHNLNVSLAYADDENISDNTQSYDIKVFGNPQFSFPTDTVQTSTFPVNIDAGAGFQSYKWNNNTIQQIVSANAEGYYIVTVTDNNLCSAKDSVYVHQSTGTNWLKEGTGIKLYPNPASNYLYVLVSLTEKQNLVMDMISPEGKVVFTKKLENMAEYREDIDVSGFPKGLYYVRLYAKDSIVVQKVVVK